MKFTCDSGDLSRALALACATADTRSTMPILANVRIEARGKMHAHLSATDLNLWLQVDVPADIATEGAYTLPAKGLAGAISKSGRTALDYGGNAHADIRDGSRAVRLVGIPATDYPKAPEGAEKTETYPTADLRDLIRATFDAIALDESRYHLSGALLEADGKVARMVATDGHRLHLCERPAAGLKLPSNVVVPRNGLRVLAKVLAAHKGPTVAIGVGKGQLTVRAGNVTLHVKLSDVQYVPWDMVVPKSHDRTAILDRVQLLGTFERMGKLAKDRILAVTCYFSDGRLSVGADNPDTGEAHETIAAEYTGKRLAIGWNCAYWIAWLKTQDCPTVRLEMQGELDPAVLRRDDGSRTLAVVMPYRTGVASHAIPAWEASESPEKLVHSPPGPRSWPTRPKARPVKAAPVAKAPEKPAPKVDPKVDPVSYARQQAAEDMDKIVEYASVGPPIPAAAPAPKVQAKVAPKVQAKPEPAPKPAPVAKVAPAPKPEPEKRKAIMWAVEPTGAW